MTRRPGPWLLLLALWVASAWVTAILDVAIAPRLQAFGAQPFFAAAITAALGLRFGTWLAAGWGFTAGLMMDILVAHPVGLLALPLAFCGLLAGWGRQFLSESSFGVPLATNTVAMTGYVILQWPLARAWGFAAPWSLVGSLTTWLSVGISAALSWLVFVTFRLARPIGLDTRLETHR